MFRRLPALKRAATALPKQSTRAFTKPSASTAASSQLASSSNVILELDTKQVGNEIRKRGLSAAVQGRDGGMDRVSQQFCGMG
jgi:hypothetical protein